MNFVLSGINPRAKGDPDYVDYWLDLIHTASGLAWELPLNKDDLGKIQGYLPDRFQRYIAEQERSKP